MHSDVQRRSADGKQSSLLDNLAPRSNSRRLHFPSTGRFCGVNWQHVPGRPKVSAMRAGITPLQDGHRAVHPPENACRRSFAIGLSMLGKEQQNGFAEART
jgi:hypothetical protein